MQDAPCSVQQLSPGFSHEVDSQLLSDEQSWSSLFMQLLAILHSSFFIISIASSAGIICMNGTLERKRIRTGISSSKRMDQKYKTVPTNYNDFSYLNRFYDQLCDCCSERSELHLNQII